MSEIGEIPQELEVVTSPELRREIEAATAQVRERMRDPAHQAAERIKEVGLLGAMKDAYWPHAKKIMEASSIKEGKVILMGVLSALPIVGHGKDVVQAVQGVSKAKEAVFTAERARDATQATEAWGKVKDAYSVALKKLTAKQAQVYQQALGRGASRYEALFYAQQGAITMTGWEKVKHWGVTNIKDTAIQKGLQILNPYPDVPPVVHDAAFMIGLLSWIPHPATQVARFAHLIPVAWQYVHNRYEMVKEGVGAVKDVGSVLRAQVNLMITDQKKPEVARAAAVFARPSAG